MSPGQSLCGLATALVLCACGASGSGGGAPAAAPLPETVHAIVEMGGARLALSAQVWLDHRPGGPEREGPGPLHVAVQVGAAGGRELPAEVGVDRVWVVARGGVWESGLDRLVRDEGRLAGAAGGGPGVPEGLPARVVVRLTGPDGPAYVGARVARVAAAY